MTAVQDTPAVLAEVLPNAWETTHQPAVCAAWADGQGVARATACPGHWRVGGERPAAVVVPAGGVRVFWHREGLTAEQEYREGLGPDPRR